MHRRRKWQPTPVFLPEKFHGQRSLVGCNPRGLQKVEHSWTAEHACFSGALWDGVDRCRFISWVTWLLSRVPGAERGVSVVKVGNEKCQRLSTRLDQNQKGWGDRRETKQTLDPRNLATFQCGSRASVSEKKCSRFQDCVKSEFLILLVMSCYASGII